MAILPTDFGEEARVKKSKSHKLTVSLLKVAIQLLTFAPRPTFGAVPLGCVLSVFICGSHSLLFRDLQRNWDIDGGFAFEVHHSLNDPVRKLAFRRVSSSLNGQHAFAPG